MFRIGERELRWGNSKGFREVFSRMESARCSLIIGWNLMGHANGEMARRYGKQLLDNVRWRQECAAKVGLGFMLPEDQNNPLLDKSGQVFEVEIAETVLQ
jgi:hypothetical protein